MSKVRRSIENGLASAFLVAAGLGVIAWNTKEKCLSGIGLLPDLGFSCPSSGFLAISVAVISFAAFIGTVLHGLRKGPHVAHTSGDNDEA